LTISERIGKEEAFRKRKLRGIFTKHLIMASEAVFLVMCDPSMNEL
jgi:hypothetical protein